MPSKRCSFPHCVLLLMMAFKEAPPFLCAIIMTMNKDTKTIQNYQTIVPLSPALVESVVCHLSVTPPICKKYAPVLYWKALYMFWLSLLACAAPFSMVCLGLLVCFLQFCMVLPSFLHSLPRLNGLERGVCYLTKTPQFARNLHLP